MGDNGLLDEREIANALTETEASISAGSSTTTGILFAVAIRSMTVRGHWTTWSRRGVYQHGALAAGFSFPSPSFGNMHGPTIRGSCLSPLDWA